MDMCVLFLHADIHSLIPITSVRTADNVFREQIFWEVKRSWTSGWKAVIITDKSHAKWIVHHAWSISKHAHHQQSPNKDVLNKLRVHIKNSSAPQTVVPLPTIIRWAQNDSRVWGVKNNLNGKKSPQVNSTHKNNYFEELNSVNIIKMWTEDYYRV